MGLCPDPGGAWRPDSLAWNGPRAAPDENSGSGLFQPAFALCVHHFFSVGNRGPGLLESARPGNKPGGTGPGNRRSVAHGVGNLWRNDSLVRQPDGRFAKVGPASRGKTGSAVSHNGKNHATNYARGFAIRGAGLHGGTFRRIPVSRICPGIVRKSVCERDWNDVLGQRRVLTLVCDRPFISG